MTIAEVNIDGTTYLCQLTLDEKRRIDAGHTVTIPKARRVVKRLGIARSMQLHCAGIATPPVMF